MTDPVIIFYIPLLFFGIIYLVIISIYTYGWFRLKTYKPPDITLKTQVSIIIPARNEEKNITNLLADLVKQDFSKDLFEIIVIDDNSSDQTVNIVNSFISSHPEHKIQLIKISEEEPFMAYKKKAISLAIEKSKGDLIVTTDADCRLGEKWLKSIVSFYESEKPGMIVGPVSFHNEKSFFEKMQTLEFLSFIAITGGAIKIGNPIMCNGANLAYEKKAFYDVGRFGGDEFSSGDDVFLMLKIKKYFGNKSVRFLKNYNAFVFTEAKKTLRDFFNQRTRWASKNKGYDFKILFISVTVYMINLLLLTGLVLSIFYPFLFKIVVFSYLVKLIIDIPILIGIGNFIKRSRMFIFSLPLILIYPVYIILTGALGIVGNYQWKGRKVKK